jgi:hypothetical protein
LRHGVPKERNDSASNADERQRCERQRTPGLTPRQRRAPWQTRAIGHSGTSSTLCEAKVFVFLSTFGNHAHFSDFAPVRKISVVL